MKEIPLTQGKISLVDDEDYERLNQFKWYPNWNGYTWYAKRANGAYRTAEEKYFGKFARTA